MKVILQRDLPKVGKDGEIVNVADGYARNYLFPRQFAVAATGGALKSYQARQTREKERETHKKDSAAADAQKLEGLSLTIIGKVGSGTKLYGSITAQDVADAIQKEQGVTVDKRRIGLPDPIKSLGSYSVPVRLHSDVSVSVTVDVLTEQELERRKVRAAADAAAAAAEPPAPAEPAETAPESSEESASQSAE